jgi:uncharacterized membrane protein YeaQ/YmgE (transglycosylase-associated protein family)
MRLQPNVAAMAGRTPLGSPVPRRYIKKKSDDGATVTELWPCGYLRRQCSCYPTGGQPFTVTATLREVGMGVVTWIVVGLVVGALARLFMPGRDPIGIIATILLGIAGAVLGGWLWALLFGSQEGVAWIASIVVAVALLAIYRKLAYRRRRVV